MICDAIYDVQVQLLRLLALKTNIVRHLGASDPLSGPSVLRAMASRAVERRSPGTPYVPAMHRYGAAVVNLKVCACMDVG